MKKEDDPKHMFIHVAQKIVDSENYLIVLDKKMGGGDHLGPAVANRLKIFNFIVPAIHPISFVYFFAVNLSFNIKYHFS